MDIIKEASPLFDAPLLPVILKKRGSDFRRGFTPLLPILAKRVSRFEGI